MSSTPYASVAGAARQRLAASLAALQADPNLPANVLEIVQGLARAMGPLFQLERGSTDTSLLTQARGVLQETLAKMQTVDQAYPGVADATGAIAQSLGMIFQAMREAGLVPAAPGATTGGAVVGGAPPAQAQPQPAAQMPSPQPQAAPGSAAHEVGPTAQLRPPSQPAMPAVQPVAQAPAPQRAPSQPGMPAMQPAAQPIQNAPMNLIQKGAQPGAVPFAQPAGQPRQAMTTGGGGSVPIGPNGLPVLEAEIGVHSETNFYTDFVGDIRNHGGIFVATFHLLPIGTRCEVALTFPGNLRANLQGTVRWTRESRSGASTGSSPGLGIEISNAPAEAWNLIDRFMAKREPIMLEM